jgi:predicted porin
MNKKLLTAAIAAVIAAPTAALANDVTIYGVIHASVDYRIDEANFRGSVQDPFDQNDTWGSIRVSDDEALDGFDVASRATRIGFKGSEDLANGLKAIWKIEAQADIADRGGSCASAITANGTTAPYGATSPTMNQGTAGSYLGLNGLRAAVIGNKVFNGLPTESKVLAALEQYGSANYNARPQCDTGDWWTARNAYIGLAGGWGTFLVGRHDTPYKMSSGKLDLFADTLADYNSTIGFVDIRTNSAIAYVSPSWSGLSFAGAMVAPHVYASDGSSTADADSLAEAYSLALTYDNAGFFATIAYESISDDWIDAWTNATAASTSSAYPLGNPLLGADTNEKMRVALGWSGAGFTVGGIYEWEDNMIAFPSGTDGERWQIQAGYTFGNNMIKAMYGQGDFTGSWQCFDCASDTLVWDRDQITGENSAWAIGLDHNFSKRTKAYVLYTNVDYSQEYRDQRWSSGQSNPDFNDSGWTTRAKAKLDGDAGGFSIGMIHSF